MHDQKKDMTSSVTWPERLEYLNLCLKQIFLHKTGSYSCVTLEILVLYFVRVIIPLFLKHK